MIILASNSWLRKTVMERSGLPFQTFVADVDERALERDHEGEDDVAIVRLLARAKAEAARLHHPENLVIAADSFGVLPSGERLHKPESGEKSIDLCLKQSGQTIKAVTAIAMAYRGKILIDHTITDITYVDFDRATITELLRGDDGTIRNGGLGFFMDAPGFTLVKSFNGSYTGAMGLPMEIVRANIIKLGYQIET